MPHVRCADAGPQALPAYPRGCRRARCAGRPLCGQNPWLAYPRAFGAPP